MKEVEKKWRNLRTQYTRERGKMKKRKTGTGVDNVYVTRWLHYKQLEFLEDYVTLKTTQSNFEVSKIFIKLDHVLLP